MRATKTMQRRKGANAGVTRGPNGGRTQQRRLRGERQQQPRPAAMGKRREKRRETRRETGSKRRRHQHQRRPGRLARAPAKGVAGSLLCGVPRLTAGTAGGTTGAAAACLQRLGWPRLRHARIVSGCMQMADLRRRLQTLSLNATYTSHEAGCCCSGSWSSLMVADRGSTMRYLPESQHPGSDLLRI